MGGAFLIRPKHRESVRTIARQAYLDNPGDETAAIRQASRQVETQLVGSIILAILLGVAIQLAIDLIVHWIKENILEPAPEYQSQEPGYADE